MQVQMTIIMYPCNLIYYTERWFTSGNQIQGGHGTGKTGNLAVNFSRQGKHREFSKFIFLHRENGANTGKILNFLKILLLKWQQGDGAFLS